MFIAIVVAGSLARRPHIIRDSGFDFDSEWPSDRRQDARSESPASGATAKGLVFVLPQTVRSRPQKTIPSRCVLVSRLSGARDPRSSLPSLARDPRPRIAPPRRNWRFHLQKWEPPVGPRQTLWRIAG